MQDWLAYTSTGDLKRQFDAAESIARAAQIIQEVILSTADEPTKAKLGEATELLLSAAETVIETTTHSTESLSGSVRMRPVLPPGAGYGR